MKQEKIDFYFEVIKEILQACFEADKELSGIDIWKHLWMENKSRFFPYFDENGRREISINLKDEPIKKPGLLELLQVVEDLANKMLLNGKYSDRICTYQVKEYLCNIFRLFEEEEIVTNRIIFSKIQDPGRTGKFLPKGTKVSKYIKYLELYPNIHSYSDLEKEQISDFVNIVYSQFLNMLSNFGTVILSINPLDFLLVSAHTTGWKSCHNFFDGCYKTGGISYMLDPVTLVGYATNAQQPIKYYNYKSNFDWPVKVWRSMVFMDTRNWSAVISRQYPGVKNVYAKYLRKLVGRTLAEMAGVEPKWKVRFVSGILKNDDNEEDDDDNGHYCLSSASTFNYSDPITGMIKLKGIGKNPSLEIGSSEIPCMVCGDYRSADEENHHEYFTCDGCGDRNIRCANCGDYCGTDYVVASQYYCEDCYNELFTTCFKCSEIILVDDAYYYGNEHICECCKDHYFSTCDRCRELSYKNEFNYIADINEYWCNYCASNYAYMCQDCGEYTGNPVDIGKIHYCENCAASYYCKQCGNYSIDVVDHKCKNCKCFEVKLESVGV